MWVYHRHGRKLRCRRSRRGLKATDVGPENLHENLHTTSARSTTTPPRGDIPTPCKKPPRPCRRGCELGRRTVGLLRGWPHYIKVQTLCYCTSSSRWGTPTTGARADDGRRCPRGHHFFFSIQVPGARIPNSGGGGREDADSGDTRLHDRDLNVMKRIVRNRMRRRRRGGNWSIVNTVGL